MSYSLIAFLVIVLPTVIAVVGVLVGIKVAKGESHKFWWFIIIIAGSGTSILTWVSQSHARLEHQNELKEQRDAVESLKIIIQTNEIKNAGDLGYMKAKLEDSERLNQQYAPAIKRLAETSAEYMRKQYENKVISDKELYEFTMGVVEKIRDFSQKYEALSRQQIDEMMASVRQAATEAEQHQRWQKGTQDSIQFYYIRDNEFRTKIFPDAMFAKQEMLKRKLSEPAMSEFQKSDIDVILMGSLAGVHPDLALADYLELMAKPLSQK